MAYKTFVIFSITLIFIVLVTGCSSPQPIDTVVLTELPSVTKIPSSTQLPVIKPTKTPTLRVTHTFTQTKLPTAIAPIPTISFVGTPISASSEPISTDNLSQLSQVAQWGLGVVLAVAFTPDASKYVVGSASGIAIYDTESLNNEPIWLPFDFPINYIALNFSQDGKYIRFSKPKGLFEYIEFSTGKIVELQADQAWVINTIDVLRTREISLLSPDGTKQLHTTIQYTSESMDTEISIREIVNPQTLSLLFKLSDDTLYIGYTETNRKQGCDLPYFEMCGNAYAPVAYLPNEVAFSPNGRTLAILYTPRSDSGLFRKLRLYDLANGSYLYQIGNNKRPVQTFSYNPEGTQLLIGYVDGTIELWDIDTRKSIHNTWHFNDYLTSIDLTKDGKFLLLGRPGVLEVRSMSDGLIHAQYELITYDLSPTDPNVIAIAGSDNVVRIRELDTGRAILKVLAHDDLIRSLAFSPDGKYLATSGEDCRIKLWDAKTGAFIHYFEKTVANALDGVPILDSSDDNFGDSRIFVNSMTFIEGTDQLVGFGSWGTLVNWNIDSGATNYVIYSAPLDFYMGMMTVTPHFPESFFVNLAKNQFFIGENIYDLRTGEALGTMQTTVIPPYGCEEQGVRSKDGTLLFTRGYDTREGQVCVIDTHDNILVNQIKVIPNPDYDLYVAGLVLSPDGRSLIVATTMGAVYVYQITH